MTENKATIIVTETSKSFSKEFSALEQKVRNAQSSFLIEGEALNEISNMEYYKERGYATFDQYVQNTFDISVNYAYKRMAAYRVHSILKAAGYKPSELPKTESQCRPLTKLNGDDQPELQRLIIPVWEKVLGHNCRITAALISKEVDIVLGKSQATPAKKAADTSGVPADNTGTDQGTALPDTNVPADTTSDPSPEIEYLKGKVADLELKLQEERTKKAGAVPNSKLARDMIQAGFRALAPTLDDAGKKELLEIKKAMLGI